MFNLLMDNASLFSGVYAEGARGTRPPPPPPPASRYRMAHTRKSYRKKGRERMERNKMFVLYHVYLIKVEKGVLSWELEAIELLLNMTVDNDT